METSRTALFASLVPDLLFLILTSEATVWRVANLLALSWTPPPNSGTRVRPGAAMRGARPLPPSQFAILSFLTLAIVATRSIAGLDPWPAWEGSNDREGDREGWCVGTAGDVNGDGYVLISDIALRMPAT